MRLKEHEVQAIKDSFAEVFEGGELFLFGSRTNDAARGGDIDLFLDVSDKTDLFKKRLRFLARIKRRLGDQHIDVVFATDPARPIEQEARKWAIPL